ncbi:MAG: single-stranded-DNA-specific exonuclease RecJ [Alphaproteobacteria bacterium]|nr:single-stranded-DNA-specific exonuclease RecJ [Alphaproteobacteria bacterium]
MAMDTVVPTLSLSGKAWHFASPDQGDVQHLMAAHNISEMISRALLQLGITGSDAEDFLNPKLKNLLPDPFILKDMEKGVGLVIKTIAASQKIAIFADYDVDGATSSAILRRYFQTLGIQTELYIPDRLEEGYGPNVEAMHTLHRKGINLIIIVDCGTLAFEPIKAAYDLGMCIVVIDHHMSENTLPKQAAIINPNRFDEDVTPSYLKDLCAAGMSFMFIVALQKRLREQGYFLEKNHQPEPDLLKLLDLVALGTVCDVMPLTYLNRVFVTHGLRLMGNTPSPGLSSLMTVAGCHTAPTSYHLGFVLGPRINAGGRVGEAWMGSSLLSSDDTSETDRYSARLNELNIERQGIERIMLDEAYNMVENNKLYERPVILVSHDTWHPGVIGIAASRLKERYNKPALVVSYMMDKAIGKGSGRSIAGASLGDAMHEAVKQGLLVLGGGHAMAAGFSLHRDQYNNFYDFICHYLEAAVDAFVPRIQTIGWLSLSALTIPFVKSLSVLEPFGHGNPTPKFTIGPVSIRFVNTFGQGHVRLVVEDAYGNRAKVTHFRAEAMPYYDLLLSRQGMFYFSGSLKIDAWNNREEVAFMVDDVAQEEEKKILTM